MDLAGPPAQPLHDPAAQRVHSARSSDMCTTGVDGRAPMRDRRLPAVDGPAAVAELAAELPDPTRRRQAGRIREDDG